MIKYLLACTLVFFFSGSLLSAQTDTGTILGVVKDSSGAVIPAATVSAREVETNQTRTLTTDGDGAYRFDQMPVGTYEIKVGAEGFSTDVQNGLALAVGQELVSNFTLQVGAVSQTVSVSAETASIVTTTSASLSSLVTPDAIQDMPLNGRNYNDLAVLQMGVTKAPIFGTTAIGFSGTQFSSNGAPQRSNSYMMDGGMLTSATDNNGASALGTTLGVDGIQEYRIITNNFDAEYGLAMGSQTVIVSKSGTNAFHGDAFEFLRNNVLDARNYFDLPVGAEPLHGHRNPEFRRNQFGGAVGGPIQKDKTFFFAVYEGLRAYLGATELSTTAGTTANPTGCQGAAGATITIATCPQLGASSAVISDSSMAPFLTLFPAPNIAGNSNNFGWIFNQVTPEDYGQIRIDHTFSNSDNLFGRYTVDQSSLPIPGSYYAAQGVESSRNQFFTIAENHIFSPAVVNSARYAFTREPLLLGNQVLDSRLLEPQFTVVPNDHGTGFLSVGGVGTLGNSVLTPGAAFENLSTVADDVNYNRGKHSFRFGFVVNHYAEKFITHGYDRGTFVFGNLVALMQGNPATASVILPGGDDVTKYLNFDTMGFYGQDSWKVRSRLVLNIGMRYEPTTSVNEIKGNVTNLRNPLTDTTYTPGNPVFKNASLRNWSPRFGFAWDVFGDGKTAVRGGFDVLYDLSTLGSAYGQFAGYDPPYAQFFNTANYESLYGPLQVPAVLPALGSFQSSIRSPSYVQNQPHLMSYNFAVERELPYEMAVTLAYSGSKGLDLYSDEEGNNVEPSGVPVTNGGVTTCAQAPVGTVLNNASQFDGSATSCYFFPTNTSGSGSTAQIAVPQCGLSVGVGTPPAPHSGNCYDRVNDAFPSIIAFNSDATSFYSALDAKVTKRVTRGLQFDASYVWSRLLDNHEASSNADTAMLPIEPLHRRSRWAPAQFDLTHVFHFTGTYHFPSVSSANGLVGKLANGWMTNGILSLQTGYPFSAIISNDRSNISYANGYSTLLYVPDLVPGRTSHSITHGNSTGCGAIAAGTPLGTPKLWFDPCAFSIQPAGFIGTEPRNFLRGPGLANLDFSLIKDTAVKKLGEAGKVEFRAEVFDLFNHPNFAPPSTTAGIVVGAGGQCTPNAALPYESYGQQGCAITPPASAGRISSTIGNVGALPGGVRQIQFGLKVMF